MKRLFAALAGAAAWGLTGAHPALAADAPSDDAAAILDLRQDSPQARQAFHERMLTIKTPHPGCFVAKYPNPTWQETACGSPPKYPNPIPRGPKPNNVGAGTDYFTSESNLTSVTGSFDSVTGVTNEYGSKGNDLTTVYPNVYALQLNSNIFSTPACVGSSNCSGWEQFIYSQSQCGTQACIFIEYWLLNHASPCPSTGGWFYYPGSATTTPGCYLNTTPALFPVQTLGNMGALRLTGQVSGGTDTVSVSLSNGDVPTISNPSIADLGQGWNGAEFNLVGDCCASEAYFTGGPATLVVRQSTQNGATAVPVCTTSFSGTTAEQNNLNLVGACTTISGASPAIVFTESGGSPLPPGISIGDPHLTTFQGVHYNFMEAGEFTLLQADPGFLVQTRQALAPSNPGVAYNVGVAVKMGDAQVTVYPSSLTIGGASAQLADGAEKALASGVTILRHGAVYTISRPSGDTVQATMMGSFVNVSVSLGATNSATAHGLLVSAPERAPVLAPVGAIIRTSATLKGLHQFAESWRLEPGESLFPDEGRPQPSGLVAPMTTEALEAGTEEAARNTCMKAGVTDAALLDDCILDVGVSGDPKQADSFVYAPKPRRVLDVK